MQHPIWVNSRGKPFRGPDLNIFSPQTLRELRMLNAQPLKPQTIFMNEDDYLDIVKWSKST